MTGSSAAGERLPGVPEPSQTWDVGGGILIAGDVWGPPDGQSVVLMHGGGQTRHAWKGTGQRLAELGYRAVALDARGHGDSSWASDYSPDGMIADVQAVLAALRIERPVLVGASLGGVTALIAVGEGLIDAAALVLVDVAPRLETHGVERISAFMDARPEGFETLREVADAISAYQPHRPRPKTLDGLAKNVRRGHDDRFRWHWDPSFRDSIPDRSERQRLLERCAQRVAIPTLLVRGGMSDVLSPQGAQEFLQLCPHALFVDVANAGHMVAGDRNDAFSHAIIDFLRRETPPRS